MVNSIVERYSRVNPLTQTEIKIIRSAIKLFLSAGYTHTTFRQIAEDSGVKLGVITYHFRTKEDLLLLLAEQLMDYHAEVIEEACETGDVLFAYAMEIVTQITICEKHLKMWDLYNAIYSHSITYESVKTWGTTKNYNLFKERLPHWTENNFREKEIIASGIELAALKAYCDKNFTLERKIEVVLDSLLMIYEVTKEERERTIKKILASNYKEVSNKLLDKFTKRLN